MKNFYALLLAGCVAFSSAAIRPAVGALKAHQFDASAKKEAVARKAAVKAESNLAKKQKRTVAKFARKADAESTIEGPWVFTFGDYYFGDYSIGEFEEDMIATLFDDEVYFESVNGQVYYPFIGKYDQASGTLTFSRMYLNIEDEYEGIINYIWQEPYVYDYTTNDLDFQDIKGYFSSEYGIIQFAEDNGIAFYGYLDEDGTQPDEYPYWDILDILGATRDGNSGGNPGGTTGTWSSVGQATFMDGWLLPALGFDQFDEKNWYKVELEQNSDNANLYRLVDPYHGNFPGVAYNETDRVGYIEFDVTMPDHVIFNVVEAGFANTQLDLTYFYPFNELRWYVDILGDYSPAEVVAAFGQWINGTTYKDGVVTLSYIIDEDTGETIWDAGFGDQNDYLGGYYWPDADMTTKIFFPSAGVENVTLGSANNAPVEYFNLQGVRVNNPERGQLVVKRQGSEVSKVIVR